jgi:bacillopeptidase F
MRAKSRRSFLLLAAACLTLLWAAPTSQAQVVEPGLDRVLDRLGADETVPVIVRFVQRADLRQLEGQSPARLRAEVVGALKAQAAASRSAVERVLSGPGVTRRASLWAINGEAITASAGVIRALADDPNVESIRLDAVIRAPAPETVTSAAAEWNLSAIRAPELWSSGYTGAGVVVAGVDTGVDAAHPDLATRFRGGTNSWYDPNGQHATPYDRTGHGTQTMGLIVGGDAGGTSIGAAPDARWIAVKIFNDAGSASYSAIHQGFQWLLDPDGNARTDDAPDVVNNSWSLGNVGGCSLEFEPDLQLLKTAQIAVVFAAGNYGPASGSSVSPANNPSGFAVGAVDVAATIAGSSSSGPSGCDGTIYPEVVAPGIGVRTTDLSFGGLPDSYVPVSGTSFAAPHVTGAMALLHGAHPGATVIQLERALTETAIDGGPPGPDNAYGSGRIDVVAAEGWLANPPGPVCTDLDGDGFFAEAACNGATDCNDLNAAINPAACDIKSDGIDQNCDGADRTKGKDCPGGGGDPVGGSEGKGTTCNDGIDNDRDGRIDCADADCAGNRSCR